LFRSSQKLAGQNKKKMHLKDRPYAERERDESLAVHTNSNTYNIKMHQIYIQYEDTIKVNFKPWTSIS